ncbi:S8 family serine peptidase [Kitasatospora sp. NBC_00374]|uniref:S8 family serine peptidase n=1 Tax=Kitasatospora sp. NBC_00374 TaxID=2975964 RepID=UPI0030DE8967
MNAAVRRPPGVGSAGAVLAGVVLSAGVLLPAGAARADTPGPSAAAGAPGDALPGVTQLRRQPAGKPAGCLPASAKGTQLTPWPQTFLRPDRVWPLSQGDGVTVAVLGSGVSDGSGLLAGRIDFAAKLPDAGDPARDCVGHGTFLAGLIAADRRDGAGFAGLAPHARILAVGVTDDTGATSPDLLAQGITAAAERGARVIDVGVTVPTGSDALAAAVRLARSKGALVVAPAAPDVMPGSQGDAKPEPVYPTAYPEVLAVRDLGPGGALPEDGAAAVGGRVDLTAPGDAVMSTGPTAGGYYTGSGPSYATAFVAGAAALVLGYRPGLSADQLAHRLEATAYRAGGAVPDPQVGHGTVDPVAAVTSLLAQEQSTPSPAGTAPATPTVPVMPPARPASAAPRQAAVVALGALGVIALVALAAAIGPRGRARGWQPPKPEPGGGA